jgi:hypothetical protein
MRRDSSLVVGRNSHDSTDWIFCRQEMEFTSTV